MENSGGGGDCWDGEVEEERSREPLACEVPSRTVKKVGLKMSPVPSGFPDCLMYYLVRFPEEGGLGRRSCGEPSTLLLPGLPRVNRKRLDAT